MSGNELIDKMRGVTDADFAGTTKQVLDSLDLDSAQKQLADRLVEALTSGSTVAAVYNLTARDLELIYSVAHSLYMNRKYEKALPIFKFLTVFDHLSQKWWVGLGATLQMMKKFEDAVNAFAMATVLDATDPKPQLQAGYCLLMLGRKTEAREALEGAVIACGSSHENAPIRMQAEALIKSLSQPASAMGR